MNKTYYIYTIRDREAGNIISSHENEEEALDTLKQYEETDKENEEYEKDFYEVIEEIISLVESIDNVLKLVKSIEKHDSNGWGSDVLDAFLQHKNNFEVSKHFTKSGNTELVSLYYTNTRTI